MSTNCPLNSETEKLSQRGTEIFIISIFIAQRSHKIGKRINSRRQFFKRHSVQIHGNKLEYVQFTQTVTLKHRQLNNLSIYKEGKGDINPYPLNIMAGLYKKKKKSRLI